jgi:hypothetical protein
MKKQIIVISEMVCTLPNVITVSLDQFLSATYKNIYVLIDRSDVSTKQIMQIKKRCEETGLNPFLDGGFMDISYIFVPDWQAEAEEECYNKPILDAIQYLEECETQRKLFELEDKKTINETVCKLLRLAKCPSVPFGEKRNATDAAYKIIFSI